MLLAVRTRFSFSFLKIAIKWISFFDDLILFILSEERSSLEYSDNMNFYYMSKILIMKLHMITYQFFIKFIPYLSYQF